MRAGKKRVRGLCAGWQIHAEIMLQENCSKEMIFAKQEAQKEINQVLTVSSLVN